MRALLIAGLLFAAACGGKSDAETMDPCKDPCKDSKMSAHTCESMADHVGADMPGELRAVFADQCSSTGWSQEAIDCMSTAESEEAGEACAREHLSAEQNATLEAEFEKADEGGGGDGEEGME